MDIFFSKKGMFNQVPRHRRRLASQVETQTVFCSGRVQRHGEGDSQRSAFVTHNVAKTGGTPPKARGASRRRRLSTPKGGRAAFITICVVFFNLVLNNRLPLSCEFNEHIE